MYYRGDPPASGAKTTDRYTVRFLITSEQGKRRANTDRGLPITLRGTLLSVPSHCRSRLRGSFGRLPERLPLTYGRFRTPTRQHRTTAPPLRTTRLPVADQYGRCLPERMFLRPRSRLPVHRVLSLRHRFPPRSGWCPRRLRSRCFLPLTPERFPGRQLRSTAV